MSQDRLVLTRFVEGEDIEAFLTTFERLMEIPYPTGPMGGEAGATTLRMSTTGIRSNGGGGSLGVLGGKESIPRYMISVQRHTGSGFELQGRKKMSHTLN